VRQRGACVLGIVLNGITSDNPYYYYSHYYHAYYNQGRPESATKSEGNQPARLMAAPQQRRTRLMSIEEEARVRAEGRQQSHLFASEDQHKVELFKSRRTGGRTAAPPSPSAGASPPGEAPPSV
jgi:hypothetical protein